MRHYFPGALLLISLCTIASAEPNDISFTITPMTQSIDVSPNTEYTGVITVKNDISADQGALSVSNMDVDVSLSDWSLDTDGKPQFFEPGTTKASCAPWITINPVNVTVPPGDAQAIRYTIAVPSTAAGTYRCLLLFESKPSDGQRHAVRSRIGSSLFVHVGVQARRARIRQFSSGADTSRIRIENTGSVELRVKGVVKYADADGRTVAQASLPNSLILPGTDNLRDIVIQTPENAATARHATVLLDYGGDVLLGARTDIANARK